MFFPIHNHSHYSLLSSTTKIDRLLAKVAQNAYKACGLTDFTTISGSVSFIKECNKAKIRPILGCEIIFSDSPVELPTTLILLCKNKSGWKKLLKIISESNDKENCKGHPSLPIKRFHELDLSDFIIIDGYVGSIISSVIFEKFDESYLNSNYDTLAEECLNRNWKGDAELHISHMLDRFGDNYFVELPIFESETFPATTLLANCIKEVLTQYNNVNVLYENPNYYLEREDSLDHRVLIASKLKTTLRELGTVAQKNGNFPNNKFLLSSSFYLPSAKDTKDIKDDHDKLLGKIEEFDILSAPILPPFPGDKPEIELLKDWCRIGWKEKIVPIIKEYPEQKQEYEERIKYELGVIEKAGLSGYFLIIGDIINHFRSKGCLVGPARGSSAGSLIAFLMGIVLVNPIKYGLLFSRFYNESRIGSLPDIDTDFPPSERENAIEYLKEKYGHDKVCQIATFGTLAGRAALKEVLRVNESCNFQTMNEISKWIPDYGKVSDQLEEMENPSLIMWALENNSKQLKDYCRLENRELKGDFAQAFAQALRIENLNKSSGKHAAGVLVSKFPLDEVCPMIKSTRGNEKICGFDMNGAADVGLPKMDILGVSSLEKIQRTCEMVGK